MMIMIKQHWTARSVDNYHTRETDQQKVSLIHLRRADFNPSLFKNLLKPARKPPRIQAYHKKTVISWEFNDTQTGMLLRILRSARCVQRFDDSLGVCNSHYLSHFAAFFIDARAKRSIAESCIWLLLKVPCVNTQGPNNKTNHSSIQSNNINCET